MAKPNLTKDSKLLLSVIEAEGGRILDVRHKTNHIHVDYTFDDHHVYHQNLPKNAITGGKWVLNFRTTIRRAKRDSESRQPKEH